MLCLTCPLRPTCKSACEDLKRELFRIEKIQTESPKTPQQIEGIELYQALQTEFRQPESEVADGVSKFDAEKLEDALRSLTTRQRECLQLFYWESLSHKKIAIKFGIKRQTVSQHLEAAVTTLREHYLPSVHIGERV